MESYCEIIAAFKIRNSGTKQKSPRRLHAEDGKFVPDYAGETKHLRSMRLTDTAWKPGLFHSRW
jgi:hypothetical protein